jgi:hypothetical protein
MPQDKARSAVNGPSLNKDRNAGLGHLRASRRADMCHLYVTPH